jgi:hypothetical protein
MIFDKNIRNWNASSWEMLTFGSNNSIMISIGKTEVGWILGSNMEYMGYNSKIDVNIILLMQVIINYILSVLKII